MPRFHQVVSSAPVQIVIGAALAALWGYFAASHLAGFFASGKVSLLAFGITETLVALLFLLRTRPKMFTTNPHEWVIALLGTFVPMMLRPTDSAPIPAAELCLIFGSVLHVAGVLSLNRSFAVVPALREIKTRGMYRFVRHPIYLSYVITVSGYLAANFSIRNLFILLASFGLMIARIHFEERHLSLTPEYRSYRDRVIWRLFPYIF